MLKQTMKVYDAEDKLILTKTRTVEDETLEMNFQAEVEIDEDVYGKLYKDWFGNGQWDEGTQGETQIYSTTYREKTGDYVWETQNDSKEIHAGRYVIEEEYVKTEERGDDE